jgi:hypothetical protein
MAETTNRVASDIFFDIPVPAATPSTSTSITSTTHNDNRTYAVSVSINNTTNHYHGSQPLLGHLSWLGKFIAIGTTIWLVIKVIPFIGGAVEFLNIMSLG